MPYETYWNLQKHNTSLLCQQKLLKKFSIYFEKTNEQSGKNYVKKENKNLLS